MQLKLLQAKQEETQGAIQEEKGEEENARDPFRFLFLSFLSLFFFKFLIEAILYLLAFVGRG